MEALVPKKYVCLRGIKEGNVFWTESSGDVEEDKRLIDGSIAYEIIKYSDSEDEIKQSWKENTKILTLADFLENLSAMKAIELEFEKMLANYHWTYNLPTEEGWYWVRYYDEEENKYMNCVVQVSKALRPDYNERLMVTTDFSMKEPLSKYKYKEHQWCRIPMPKEPK